MTAAATISRSTRLLFLGAALLTACSREPASAPATQAPPPPAALPQPAEPTSPAISWREEVAAWKQNRHERLQRPDGWLTLVGFAWLAPGDNPVGSAPDARVQLPAGKAAERTGTLRVADRKVTFVAAPGASVTSQGAPVTELEMVSDRAGDPTVLEVGPISFFVIERADRLAVRIRDREAETLARFAGLDYYPVSADWRFEAKFEPADEVRELPIPNILGFEERIQSPGHVVFRAQGQDVRLLALDDTGDGRLFLVFGDSTNGRETYGGGRFLYTAPPVGGRVTVDFNRAYNPPCVFTPYATCPLPPKGNRLRFAVAAGEKKYALEAPHPETGA